MITADPLQELQLRLVPLRATLLEHQLYSRIDGAQALRTFMEHHVFAVWDFMSLLKGLQKQLTCVEIPWRPAGDPAAARLVNEIVLAEESDDDGEGGFASHYELYVRAMNEAGANTGPIEKFVARIDEGAGLETALAEANVPAAAAAFVEETFHTVEQGSLCALAAAFTYGREDLLPRVFRKIVDQTHAGGGGFGRFGYYLNRHIELDGDIHGPMAARLVRSLCGDEPERWRQAEAGATGALRARTALWDGMLAAME
ncbi:MAG: DUF3050 domain-containing protein [Planctomycetaceae bacterium]|nr:DUF3050 domain-containing protein [Planctomycetaceae bacterium]